MILRHVATGQVLGLADCRPKPQIKYRVLRMSTRVGNFLSCPSMLKIAWVWIATIPAIWEAPALLSGLNRDP